jgi:hypothetical protein
MTNFENIVERAMAKVGSPPMAFEIDSDTLELLYKDAQNKYYLYKELSKKTEETLTRLKEDWIESYFQSNVKEALGNVRGKFSGEANIPGATLTIEYKHLLKDAKSEKKALVKMLLDDNFTGESEEDKEELILIAIYINVGNMDGYDVGEFMKKVASQLNENYPSYIKHYIFPVRNQDTKVDLIYPVSFGKNKEKLMDMLDSIKDMDERIKKFYSDEK